MIVIIIKVVKGFMCEELDFELITIIIIIIIIVIDLMIIIDFSLPGTLLSCSV